MQNVLIASDSCPHHIQEYISVIRYGKTFDHSSVHSCVIRSTILLSYSGGVHCAECCLVCIVKFCSLKSRNACNSQTVLNDVCL